MSLLKNGDYIGIVACSNGQPLSNNAKIENLLLQLESLDLTPICSKYIYEINSPFNGSAEAKGEIFMDLYKNDKIKAIFDISGGDLANEVLDYLDYKYIAETPKPFFGYSDLTTVLNAIYSLSNKKPYLFW